MFKIIKAIRAGHQSFTLGQEEQLLEFAAANPTQLDFFRLLDTGCISEIPETITLTREQQEQRRQAAEAERVKKVDEANELAARHQAEELEKIEAARQEAAKRQEEAERLKKEEVARNTGDGEDGQ